MKLEETFRCIRETVKLRTKQKVSNIWFQKRFTAFELFLIHQSGFYSSQAYVLFLFTVVSILVSLVRILGLLRDLRRRSFAKNPQMRWWSAGGSGMQRTDV